MKGTTRLAMSELIVELNDSSEYLELHTSPSKARSAQEEDDQNHQKRIMS